MTAGNIGVIQLSMSDPETDSEEQQQPQSCEVFCQN